MKRRNMMRKDTRNCATSTKRSLNTIRRDRSGYRNLGGLVRPMNVHRTPTTAPTTQTQTEIATDKYPGMV
jgi:hypothetical protein